MIARFFNIAIATWILVAAAAFHPPRALFVVMLVVAFGVFASEVAGFYRNRYRFWTTALGVILILSGFVLRTPSDAVRWNNFIFGLALAVLSVFRTRTKMGRELWVPWSRNRESEVDYIDTVPRKQPPVPDEPIRS